MVRLMVYLLPMSGDILLNQLEDVDDVEIACAFLPKTFFNDCGTIIKHLTAKSIPYFVPESMEEEKLRGKIPTSGIDLSLSVGYDQILPGWLINLPDFGTVNIHPALLPRYRGANPYFWVLKNRESQTGVSLHLMDEGLDTGPILGQEPVQIDENETMGTLFFKLNHIGIELAMELLDEFIIHGEIPKAYKQDDIENLPVAPKVVDKDLRIDWSKTAEEIDALIRAANPFFGAYTTFRGYRLHIYEVSMISEQEARSRVLDSSRPLNKEIAHLALTPEGPLVRCDNGWLRLEVVQFGQFYRSGGKLFMEREREAFEVINRVI